MKIWQNILHNTLNKLYINKLKKLNLVSDSSYIVLEDLTPDTSYDVTVVLRTKHNESEAAYTNFTTCTFLNLVTLNFISFINKYIYQVPFWIT